MTLDSYIDKLDKRYRSGITTEHSFRGDLQNLLEYLLPHILVTNEPTRIKCGAPDYILTKNEIPIGYIEAKDLGADLTNKLYEEQFTRYRHALNNLIITNYLDFQVFKDGKLVATYSVGKIDGKKVVSNKNQFEAFQELIKAFSTDIGQTITSSQKLAIMMANKAKLLALVINEALLSDEANEANSTLKEQLEAFKDILIHDITPREFADLYAQSIAYGMFAARLHDPSLLSFTRKEAADLIPKSNPFLRKLFQYIAGYDLDQRIVWIVDALADIFRATDVAALLRNFGKSTQQNDPIIHFYETFLSEYDPKLRKARGVWYTPEPVVKFIVRAVDDILKQEFNLFDGIADTSKTKVKFKVHSKATADNRSKIKEQIVEKEVHKVQILDPATGTGTFLAEVVKYIYTNKFEGQQGIWSTYVENHLVPRLNGFELLMASYAMAHLKLDLLLTETGYKPTKDQRLRIYLTNSLEEHHPDTGTLFANWLSTEANEANQIKRDVPVMVVIGNPPYSVSSSNKGEWIQNLIADYKKDLNERKINLDDDYIKFIRYGHYLVDKNGVGVLAFISNNSFIDGITHRQMRKQLLDSFDKIYILDLHGSAKKNEVSPDGSKDENVFDIQQGVSINVFIKLNSDKSGKLADVLHCDLYGHREKKYAVLLENRLKDIDWKPIKLNDPYYFFVPKNFEASEEYGFGFSLSELFQETNSGIQTKSDDISIQFDKDDLEQVISDFQELSVTELKSKFSHKKDSSGWSFQKAKTSICNGYSIIKINYRPFDERFTAYTKSSGGFIGRPREVTMKHLIGKDNVSLITCRQQSSFSFQHIFVTRLATDLNSISLQTKEQSYIFPLYLYRDSKDQQFFERDVYRVPNFNFEIIKRIKKELKLSFTNEKEMSESTFAPIDILDYIYAILHNPTYRRNNKESLKIDFPRVPYPKNKKQFWSLVKLGKNIRELHLMECDTLNKLITRYPVNGTNKVDLVRYEEEKVFINSEQYFEGVSELTWNFYIGGYLPAQKWLKDRKGRTLSFEDILHYQKMIKVLAETDLIMKSIDKIEV